MSRLQVRLVGSARPSRNVQRDRDMETTWCSEFSRLQQLLASRGGDLIIERFGRDKTVFQPRGSIATISVASCNDGKDTKQQGRRPWTGALSSWGRLPRQMGIPMPHLRLV